MSERLTDYCSADFQDVSLSPAIPLSSEFPGRGPLYKTLSAPISAQIEITERCNLACGHCYNPWRWEALSQPSTLNKEQLFHVLEELDQNTVFRLTLTGGEPLLYKETVIEAARWAYDHDIRCSINSNLTTVSEQDVFYLKEAGVYAILGSLMSFDEKTHDRITGRRGSFQKTIRGIQNILDADIPLMVHMVITQANENQVYETGRFVAGLGVEAFAATKVSPALGAPDFSEIGISRESVRNSLESLVRLQEEFDLQTDILECYPLCLISDGQRFERFARRNCSAGVSTIVVGANGEVRPCIHSDEVNGNIFQEGLKESWERMERWRDGSLIPDDCQECQYLQACTGGCRVEAQYFGDLAGKDPYASSPNDVLISSRRRPMPISEEGFSETRLQFNPHLRMRVENFGGIIGSRNGGCVLVNQDSYQLLGELKEVPFSVGQICQTHNINLKQASRFFAHLFNNKIVIRYEERN